MSQDPLKDDEHLAFYGRVRDFRAEAQNIQKIVTDVGEAGARLDPKVRNSEVKAAIEKDDRVFRENSQRIGALLRDIRRLLDKHPSLYDHYGDQIACIENFWQRTALIWPSTSEDPERALRNLEEANRNLNKAIVSCGIITIPNRVRQHLEQLPIGKPLNFHEAFSDELPDLEERRRILQYLAAHPSGVNGVVSPDEGLIFAISKSSWRRTLSVWLIIACAILGFGAVWAACGLELIDCTTGRTLRSLLRGYLLVVIGAAAHILVEFLKRERTNDANNSGLQELILRVHVREHAFILVAISLWVVFLFLVYTTAGPIDWRTAFLFGYSIDSFTDLFLQRFSQRVTTGTAALKKNLGWASEGAS